MTEAALYLRYSSAQQDRTSLEDQEALCSRKAADFGCTVNGLVYSDPETSGTIAERPGLQRLLEDAKAGKFGAVIVEAQDRISRDQEIFHGVRKRLQFAEVKLFSVETGSDLTSEAGSIVASVTGWKDEAFLGGLKEKTRRGMAGQVSRGFAAGGPPYGYRLDDSGRDDKKANSRLVIYPPEARFVLRAFEEFVSGLSCKGIARRLTAKRIRPRVARSKTDGTRPPSTGSRVGAQDS